MPDYEVTIVGPKGGRRTKRVFAPSAMEAVNGTIPPHGSWLDIARHQDASETVVSGGKHRMGKGFDPNQ